MCNDGIITLLHNNHSYFKFIETKPTDTKYKAENKLRENLCHYG